MRLSEKAKKIISLKKRGFSDSEIAKQFNVSREAITNLLKRVKEKGFWNGESGINPLDNHNYEKYLESAKTSKTFGRPLTRQEWNDLWKEKPFVKKKHRQPQEQEKREVNPDGSLKPKATKKPFPKYRCLKRKCRTPLLPLGEVVFTKGNDNIRQQLLEKGYTHVCPKCKLVYERSRSSPLEKGKCHDCDSPLIKLMFKNEFTGYYQCSNPKCKLLYQEEYKGELEKEMRAHEEVE